MVQTICTVYSKRHARPVKSATQTLLISTYLTNLPTCPMSQSKNTRNLRLREVSNTKTASCPSLAHQRSAPTRLRTPSSEPKTTFGARVACPRNSHSAIRRTWALSSNPSNSHLTKRAAICSCVGANCRRVHLSVMAKRAKCSLKALISNLLRKQLRRALPKTIKNTDFAI
jgi:hypothetical protein